MTAICLDCWFSLVAKDISKISYFHTWFYCREWSITPSVIANLGQQQFSHYCSNVPAKRGSILHSFFYARNTISLTENMYSLPYFAAVWEDLTYVFLCISRPTEQRHEVRDNCSILEASQKKKKALRPFHHSLLIICYLEEYAVLHPIFPRKYFRINHWSFQFNWNLHTRQDH